VRYLRGIFVDALRPLEAQHEWGVRAFQDLVERQGDPMGPREDEICGYLAAVAVQVMTKDPHKTDTELHEFQLTIDHKVPRECLAEARYSHAKIRCLAGEWTEGGRRYVVICVIHVGHIRAFAVTLRSDAISAIVEEANEGEYAVSRINSRGMFNERREHCPSSLVGIELVEQFDVDIPDILDTWIGYPGIAEARWHIRAQGDEETRETAFLALMSERKSCRIRAVAVASSARCCQRNF